MTTSVPGDSDVDEVDDGSGGEDGSQPDSTDGTGGGGGVSGDALQAQGQESAATDAGLSGTASRQSGDRNGSTDQLPTTGLDLGGRATVGALALGGALAWRRISAAGPRLVAEGAGGTVDVAEHGPPADRGATPERLMSGVPASFVRGRAALWRRAGDDHVVLLPMEGEPLALVGMGALLWDALAQPGSLDRLAGLVADDSGRDAELVRADIGATIDRLVERGLVDTVSGAV